jgi:large subunit ribosomal protein L22
MEAIARGKYLKGSPQKARLVIDLIRGKNVQEALAILRFTKKRATRAIEKVLLSAVANARERIATADVDRFVVDRAVVDMGPTSGAAASAGANGPGLPGAAAVQTHHHLDQGRRRIGIGEVASWVRKFIHTASDLESTGRGARAGSPGRIMELSCWKT